MKFDEEHIAILIKNLEAGNGRVAACKAAKIAYNTFLNWLEDPDKVQFLQSIKKAEGLGEDQIKTEAIKAIRSKFSDQWQSAAWWLERRHPNEYKERREMAGPDNQPIQITIVK